MSQEPEKLLYSGYRLTCRLVRGPWGLWEVHFNYAERDPPMWPRRAVNSRFLLKRTAQAVADAIEEHYRDGCRAGAYNTMPDDLAASCLRDGLISERELKWWRGT